ncbi:MAG: VWA domain-containing protein [Bacteroidaceae bacterium]|nr:VWA domain-containing protein [Bacteroidaceae bacterium]
MIYYIHRQGKDVAIETETKELSSGGQGKIYKISSPYEFKDYCVKIYKNKKHIDENKNKIQYMILNQPKNIDMHNIRICWPEYSLYDNKGQFVGFVMKLALGFPKSRDLKILSIYSFGKTIKEKYPECKEWHDKFELTKSSGTLNRMKMLHNWALAVELIHETKKYVIVDVKPDNVLATADGRISIVDADSFQINDGANVYRGPVATPEYFPKFAKYIERQKRLQTIDCDNFALAVAFYKILIGTHPFSGFKLKPPYNTDEYADISSHIEAELFAFGKKTDYIEYLSINNMHERYKTLPLILRSMFKSALTNQSNLPMATEWKNAFKQVLNGQGAFKPHADVKFNSTPNSEMKCLCVLVLDVSGSMKLCINSLNEALDKFIRDIRKGVNGFNESSKECIELSIIQFDKDVKVLHYPSLVEQITNIPILTVRGLTTNTLCALDTAFDVVEKRKREYKDLGIPYYRPWIILLTDGNPNPLNQNELNKYASKISNDIAEYKYMLTAIGIGEKIDKNILSMLSDGNYSFIKQNGFSKFFQYLSASISNPDKCCSHDDLLGEIDDSLSIML